MTEADTLEAVRKAAGALRRAQAAYRAAVLDAHDAGEPLTAIGRAAGITRQSARALVARARARRTP